MTPARSYPPTVRHPRRDGVRWDAVVAVALGVALLAGGRLDVRSYLAGRGKVRPAFALLGTATGQRIALDEFYHDTTTVVHLGNVGRLEWDNPRDDRTKFRQALGPTSTVEIWSVLPRARIELRLRNPYPDQSVTVACNGRTLDEIHLDAHEEAARQYPLELQRGPNEFTLTFTRYRPPVPGERNIAARLVALDLYLPAVDGSF